MIFREWPFLSTLKKKRNNDCCWNEKKNSVKPSKSPLATCDDQNEDSNEKVELRYVP